MTDYKGLFSHNSDEWTTPTDLYNELDKEFSFNLDPCATWVKVLLRKSKNGLVFMDNLRGSNK